MVKGRDCCFKGSECCTIRKEMKGRLPEKGRREEFTVGREEFIQREGRGKKLKISREWKDSLHPGVFTKNVLREGKNV